MKNLIVSIVLALAFCQKAVATESIEIDGKTYYLVEASEYADLEITQEEEESSPNFWKYMGVSAALGSSAAWGVKAFFGITATETIVLVAFPIVAGAGAGYALYKADIPEEYHYTNRLGKYIGTKIYQLTHEQEN